ncbi:MAG: diguanylate cyclase [Acidimicrobiales bacterium]
MHGSDEQPEGAAPTDDTGVGAELLDRLRPYLAESIMVLDADWRVKANLAPPGGLIGRGLGLGLHTLEDMHPDDAITVMDLGMQAFATEPGWTGSTVVRMCRGDDSYGHYEISATNRFDDPVIDGMVIRTREVPDHLLPDLPDLERTSTAEMLAELLPQGVLLLDHRGQVVFANHAACLLLDRTATTLKREDWRDAVAVVDRPLLDEVLHAMVAEPARGRCTVTVTGVRPRSVECRFTSEGGTAVTCVAVTLEDVTEREAAHRALEALASRDPLTGLANRAALCASLEDRLDSSDRTVVAFVDLDGFKAINDSDGHGRGDEVLVAVAAALATSMGSGRLVSRIGGDEFVVVGSDDDPLALGHAIRAAVVAVARAERVRLTASVGLAVAHDGERPADLLGRADQAMYREKSRRLGPLATVR